jgi:hypothetical protein
MRLDFTLYVLAVVFFLLTAVSFTRVEDQNEQTIWVGATMVLGLISIGLGYYERLKAKTVALQPVVPAPQPTMPQTSPETTVEAPKVEKAETAIEMPTSAQRQPQRKELRN